MKAHFMKILTGLVLSVFSFSACQKEVSPLSVAPLFSNHMVLQQQTEVPVCGQGEPGTKINISASWNAKVTTQVNPEGKWEAVIQTPKFGGPHQLKVYDSNHEFVFEDVMLGEVWLTSGQSNMEWPMYARIKNQKEEIKNANYPEIRMFTVPRNLNETNINDAAWKVTTPDNAKQFSAVGYFFARKMNQTLNIPIGIVNTSWGGTRVEAWTSLEKLTQMTPSKEEALKIQSQGGLDALRENEEQFNTEINKANEKYLGATAYSLPENIAEWEALDLNDSDYQNPNFDDSTWTVFDAGSDSDDVIAFENFFDMGSLAEDGVVWLRKTFDVENPSLDFKFIVNGGIDDFDYTYLNGVEIGKGFLCCTTRSYTIPKGLLKKEGNVLAIRIIDTGGEGGFRGSAFIESENDKILLDQGSWRFKHHAFFLEASIQAHKLNFETLTQKDEEIKTQVKSGRSLSDPNQYSILFETMLKPVIPFKIKGALWYQGESNVGNYQDYKTLFSGMITDWRAKWGVDFPFYFVQIAPYEYTPKASSQSLREAQRKTLELDKTGMAITMDIGEEKDIHPANKQDVGLRLARLALHNDYGQNEIVPSGPLYQSQKIAEGFIDLSFDYVGSGLMGKNNLSGFEIAASEGPFFPAKAIVKGSQIRVSSPKVKNPVRVRYGWENYFEATLFNKEGLPASSFQTP